MAGLSLDQFFLAGSLYGSDPKQDGNVEVSSIPTKRIFGFNLKVNVDVINYGADAHGVDLETNFWRLHDPVAIISVKQETNVGNIRENLRVDEWLDDNIDVDDSRPPYFNNTESNKTSIVQARRYVRKQRIENGVKFLFEYTGRWGFFSLSFFLNTLLQGFILLGI